MKVYWRFDPNFFFLLHPSECACLSPRDGKMALKKKSRTEDKGLSPFEITSFYFDKLTFLWDIYPVSARTVAYVYAEPYAKEKEMT